MTDERRRKALSFFFLAAIAIAAIAATLPRLALQPGIPLPAVESGAGSSTIEPVAPVAITVNTLVLALLGATLALGLAYSLYRMLLGTPWKALLRSTLLFAGFVLAFLLFLFALAMLYALIGIKGTLEPMQIENLPAGVPAPGPPLGPLPPALIWLVAAGLGAAIVLLGVWLLRGRSRSADPLRLEAERALRALSADGDFKNVIIQCYRQMSLALQRERGIQLEETMTAREFERLLEARGIPPQPVHQLTGLFEAARYGAREPGPDDQQRAFDCLSAIVQYSREGRRGG